jgi:Tol biopolymer transport system component
MRCKALAGATGLLGAVVLACGPAAVAGRDKPAAPVRLTTDGRLKFSPVFFDGGRDIIYVDFEKPELFRLQRLNVASKKIEPLHPNASKSEFEPTVSADGRFYAYLRTRGVLSVGVTVRNVAAGTDVDIAPGTGFSGLRAPALSPDGNQIAYSFADGEQHIYVVDAKGENRKALTSGKGINTEPCYSPDGKQIAFVSSRDGNFDIYVMNADGSNVRRLTNHPSRDLRPRFSPDGKRIAFTSHRDGNAEIYVMNSDGSNQRRLTHNPERDDYPAWHPDGRRLVYVSERDGKHDLYLLEVGD